MRSQQCHATRITVTGTGTAEPIQANKPIQHGRQLQCLQANIVDGIFLNDGVEANVQPAGCQDSRYKPCSSSRQLTPSTGMLQHVPVSSPGWKGLHCAVRSHDTVFTHAQSCWRGQAENRQSMHPHAWQRLAGASPES